MRLAPSAPCRPIQAVGQGCYSDAPPLKPPGFLSLSLALQGTSNGAAQKEPSRSIIIQGGPSILTKTQHPKPPVLEAAMLRKRQSKASPSDQPPPPSSSTDEMSPPGAWSLRSQWMFFAVASGACAAFNGVFAKLTTTQLTTTLSTKIADLLGLSSAENIVEYAVRGLFFVLNLTFNGVMWTLFTKALARGTSTTQVSIMNTSTNFMVTAFLGAVIFSEVLPPLWWAGAALLVAGNVIVGRKDESKDAGAAAAAEGPAYVPVPTEDEGAARKDDDEDDIIDLGRLSDERSR
ncbi:Transmembrane 42 [Fusarium albosuccineum]|uniref:Transmembrane 42 n=1 Tax=Fusarium albosuccineum TaxID=1237068 RepID=A0A8H4LK26_9HYPO|nr:Transmembrane 42 [Fusarium albosuccineum]